jgi:hypothetical protein
VNDEGEHLAASEITRERISHHAAVRMQQRAINLLAVETAFEYGREIRTRGATIYAIGRQEVELAASHDQDIAALEGVQVVCCDGVITTVYRNRNLSGLRRGENHFRRHRAA